MTCMRRTMMANSEEYTAHDMLMMAYVRGTNAAIEEQEAQGQRTMIANLRLPKFIRRIDVPEEVLSKNVSPEMYWKTQMEIEAANTYQYTLEEYAKIGIEVVDSSSELFHEVRLPEGWTIEASGHSMWSYLYDNKHRKRASIFYKANVLGGEASISLETRFSVNSDHTGNIKDGYDKFITTPMCGVVKDGDTIIYTTPLVEPSGDISKDSSTLHELRQDALAWLDAHYPDNRNAHAYWD